MTSCAQCTRAQQIAAHAHYVDSCIGCGIRQLAHMPQEKREQALDVLLKVCGRAAYERVREDVCIEMARIKALTGAAARERVA